MRKFVAVGIALAVAFGLTACGNFASTEKEVQEQSKFVEACHDAGGQTFRGAFDNKLMCDMDVD